MAIEIKQMQIHSSILPGQEGDEEKVDAQEQEACESQEANVLTEDSLAKVRYLLNDIQREMRER